MRRKRISALIADDHSMTRLGLRRLLESNDMAVAAEAASGEEAYRLYDAHRPDVTLMDINMPGIGGLEAVRRIRKRDGAAKIMMFTSSASDALFQQAMEIGIAGYVTKQAEPGEIVAAVLRVAAGEQYLDSVLAGRLLGADGSPRLSVLSALTPREFEVFRLLAEGHSVSDVAHILSISPKTAGVHHTRIMHKLDIRSPAQLVRLALQHGLVSF